MVARHHRTDAELLAGDAECFGIFYARHEDVVLAFFLRRVGRAEPAADLAAETFAAALGSRRSHDPERGDARAWLFGIARHVLAGSLRRGRVEDDARRRIGLERLVLDDAALARVEELAGAPALAALAGLPDEQRTAVAGRVVDDRSYAELAKALRCSESVVRKRVSRGLRTLRARLEGRAS